MSLSPPTAATWAETRSCLCVLPASLATGVRASKKRVDPHEAPEQSPRDADHGRYPPGVIALAADPRGVFCEQAGACSRGVGVRAIRRGMGRSSTTRRGLSSRRPRRFARIPPASRPRWRSTFVATEARRWPLHQRRIAPVRLHWMREWLADLGACAPHCFRACARGGSLRNAGLNM
jgi:hypothetical protein